MPTGDQTERLMLRLTDLLSNDPQFSATQPTQEVAARMLEPGTGLAELMETVATGYVDRPAVGRRATTLVRSGGRTRREILPSFETQTYGELWQRVRSLAAALAAEGVAAGDRVATLGFTSVDYTTVDMALPLLGAVAVPLHAGAPASHLQPIVDEVRPSVLACSAEHLATAVRLALETRSPATLLVFDHHHDDDDERDALAAAHAQLSGAGSLLTLEAAIESGAELPSPARQAVDPERLAVILYTSGSSGSPKGAMLPERLVQGTWCAIASMLVTTGFGFPTITLNYLPMSHTGGRSMLFAALGAGGTSYFTGRSDMSTILEDLSLVRPTQLNFVPRVWEMLHREFSSRVARGEAHDEVMADMRTNTLGARYLTALTGSAPIGSELAAWVEELIDMHVMDALGATESGSVITDERIQRPPVTDYKLVDVPELGYFSTDRPHPRGELLIKSSSLFQGYYKRDELTAEVFDGDGFYRTGDVVAEVEPDHLRFVDRRNNVLKLSNGEFVTVSKLETLFAESDLIQQIFVYGNGERAYLLAVVVPSSAAIAEHDPADLAGVLHRALREVAAAAGLEPYEVPRDIIVEPTPFSTANGLLTAIRKPSRVNLRAQYGERLEALYASHADAHHERWRAVEEGAAHAPVLETVRRAAGAVLGTVDGDPPANARFADLGGDSLSALELASALSDLFGVEVLVSVVLSPVNDLQRIAEHIDSLRGTSTAGPTFASVHGAGATTVHARDLRLDRFLDLATLDQAPRAAPATTHVRNVLLTGATGYLGRYLALEWLERMAAAGGTVTCLVRGKDDAAARSRLDEVFDRGDDTLFERYRELAREHLRVVTGDKSEELLGLEKDAWQQLAETVDLIVDPAALVNHMLPYPQLFGANVVGTAELIKLALTTRIKPVAHVSSVAVGALELGSLDEDADVRTAYPSRQVGDGYANGYATSKWAGEVLLREAHERCGLPVSVFRCDMIMAETRHRGQLNVPDSFTRLILSIAATGLAPWSFYEREANGARARSHFDGLPVDFVAQAISALGSTRATGFQTFNVMNPHDDGIGLDEYVDWLIEGGCAIERIDPYEEWFERFDSALRNMPEERRNASLLPLIDAYRRPMPPMRGAFAPTDCFRAAVERHHLGVDGAIPVIGPDHIVKYVTELRSIGLLD